ncbi:hypothetical protein T458_10715 [Brevibacillus panacihumi W25]|uniref:Uncharacterized protein n=1 Tax=Brevibacillus panacihumi W25 TaxID=1408254 RepID=V6M9A8_9BACL|nr:hypothetical protein [Brevibacillus panacihumi]EST55099.1 hypothetical protein T458_10715 [Brevibacillus panacihumi W25]
MRAAIPLIVFFLVFFTIGCVKQGEDMQETAASPSPAAEERPAAVPVHEEKSVEWAANRLLEISNRYFERLEAAQAADLPFEKFRIQISGDMTDHFISEEKMEEFYQVRVGLTALYLFHYEPGALAARTTILEQNAERIVVKTMWFANELNSGYYEISTLINQEGKWLLDERQREELTEKGFQLSIEEATIYMKAFPFYEKPVTTVDTIQLEDVPGEYGRFYQFMCDGNPYYISPVDGYVLHKKMENVR